MTRKIKIHFHAIAVHFANGVIPTSVAFLALFFLLDLPDMEKSAFYTLIVGTLGVVATVGTGLLEWRKNYQGAWVPVFKKKLILGAISLAAAVAACGLRVHDPQLLHQATPITWLYLGLIIVGLSSAAFAGYLGGRLVFH